MHAAAVSKPSLNSVKISTVNVWYWTISNAPYSASSPSVTSRQPPSTAGQIWRSVTRESPPRAEPEAARGLLEPGVEVRQRRRDGEVHERVEGQRHDHHGRQIAVQARTIETQPKPTTKSGMPSGSTSTTAHSRRSGSRALDAPGRRHAQHGAQHACTRASAGPCSTAARRPCGAAAGARTSPHPMLRLDDQEHQRQQHQAAAIAPPATLTSGQRRRPDHARAEAAQRCGVGGARACSRRLYSRPELLLQRERFAAVAQFGRRQRRGLEARRTGAARARARRPGAAGTRSCRCAPASPGRPADEVREELLRRGLVVARLQHRRAGDVDEVARVVRRRSSAAPSASRSAPISSRSRYQ